MSEQEDRDKEQENREVEADLQEILDHMRVPVLRRYDFKWLSRNLPIRNQDSPDLSVAMSLVWWLIKNP